MLLYYIFTYPYTDICTSVNQKILSGITWENIFNYPENKDLINLVHYSFQNRWVKKTI